MTDPIELHGVRFSYDGGSTWALDDVDLTIHAGERVCLVGLNGSGKSTLSRVIAGLRAPDEGTVRLMGLDVFSTQHGANAELYAQARRSIGAVFQNPEDQIVTTVVGDDVAFGPENLNVPSERIGERVRESLTSVAMDHCVDADPTQMSGGEQQRIAIAGMLAMHSDVLVLDEPTAMLDPRSRQDVLDLLDRIQQAGTTVVIVTHLPDDLVHADRVIQLDHGRIIGEHPGKQLAEHGHGEPADLEQVTDVATFADAFNQRHGIARAPHDPVVTFDHVSFRYSSEEANVIDDLSLGINRGSVTAIVGENGAGKTTFVKLLCALLRPHSGSITVDGLDITRAKRRQRKRLRSIVGLVMQRPERQLFADSVAEDVAFGPKNQGLDEAHVRERVQWALEITGTQHLRERNPFTLSGGQQRLVAIAGIIACKPSVLVLDEPCAGLDDAATARIERLLRDLNGQGVTIVLISHDLSQVERLADRVIAFGATGAPRGRNKRSEGIVSESDAEHEPVSTTDPRHSWVSSLDPRVKIVCLLVIMCSAFAMSSWLQLAIGLAATAALTLASRIGWRRLWLATHGFIIMFTLMGALNIAFVHTGEPLWHLGAFTITTGGLSTAGIYILRFLIVVVLGALLLQTTTPTGLTNAFASLLSPLRRLHWHTQETALVLSLALRFLPTLGSEALAIRDAQAARGGSIESGTPMKRAAAMCAIIIPMFAGAIRHADNLSLALQARGYQSDAPRSQWHVMHVRRRDYVLIAFTVATMLGIFLPTMFTM